MSDSPTHRTRLGAVASLVGAAAAFTVILGAGPVPSVFQLAGANEDISSNCDEVEHANDPECAGATAPGDSSTTVDDSTTSSTMDDGSTSTTVGSNPTTPAADIRSIDAASAGTVLVSVEGGSLRLVAATPASGWRVEIEHGSGREIEVDFRSGTKRVQVNVEIEDGQVRERVRARDDAAGTDVRSEDGTGVRNSSDDSRGPGNDDSSADDHSDSGHGGNDDSSADDHNGSGHGGNDDFSADDDSDDSRGHGSDN